VSKELAVFNAKLPAHLQKAVAATEEFAGGVQSGFPVISIRGRVWRVKIGGEERAYTDDNDDAVASVELVLLRSNPKPSKIHYDKKYEEGDDGKPRCFSADGVRPSAEVEDPINDVCASCPKNQWGSRITENGKKSRACSDVRRMAVVFLNDLRKQLEDSKHVARPMLLRVPPASLNPLKDYAVGLGAKGVQPYMLMTRVGFENDSDFPKLTFKPGTFLSEDEYNLAMEMRDGDDVAAILQKAAEYDSEGTTTGDEAGAAPVAAPAKAATKPVQQKPSSPSGSPAAPAVPAKPKKGKARDATAAEAEAAAVAAVAAVVPDNDDEEDEPAPAVVTTEDDDEEPAGDDFDALLKNVLGE
jgi:hypothetical protein